MHPCLSTITLEGAVKGAPSAHLEEVPLTASERVIHLTQLLVFVVPLPILLVQSTITLEGAVKGAPSAHLEEVPLTASERVIHLTQLLVFVVPLPILLVQQPS